MSTRKLFTCSALALLIVLGAGRGALAAEHSHDHGHESGSTLKLNNGEKWATDAPLRQAMEDIKADVEGLLPQIHENTLPPGEYKALAEKINGHVQYMVANCKLPPEADAQLHLLIADLLQGAEGMKSGAQGRQGAVKVVTALDAYGKHFAHPGWKPVAHPVGSTPAQPHVH